jgi:RimJ/RimL family protein N-acetyltransferase
MGDELRTARLLLRRFTEADAPAHAALYADPAVTRYLAGGPFDAATARLRSARALEKFAQHWDAHGFGPWAVVDPASGQLLGQCGLLHLPDGSDVELLYALARRAWGRGLAVEAGRAALDHGFGALGLGRVVAVTRPDHRSRRVMEKLGMRQETDREVFGMHAVCYALSADAYRATGEGQAPRAP